MNPASSHALTTLPTDALNVERRSRGSRPTADLILTTRGASFSASVDAAAVDSGVEDAGACG